MKFVFIHHELEPVSSDTYIYQMSYKMNRKSSQDTAYKTVKTFLSKIIFFSFLFKLSSKNAPFAAIIALQTFGILAFNLVRKFHATLPEAPPTSWIGCVSTSCVPYCSHNSWMGLRSGDWRLLLPLNSSYIIWRCVSSHCPVVGWNWVQSRAVAKWSDTLLPLVVRGWGGGECTVFKRGAARW